MGATRRAWYIAAMAALTLMVVAWVAWQRGPLSYDFTIYRVIADYFTTTGHLPHADETVCGIAGRYADFTPVNLRVYQLTAAHWQRFLIYQLAVLWVGLALLAAFRDRLGLSLRSLAAMCAAVVACSPMVLIGFEDKATFFTLVVLAAVFADARQPVAMGATLGLLVGWTGLGLLALPLCVLHGSRRDRIRAGVTAVVVSAALMLVAGGEVRTLVGNRLERESGDPFWYSIWRLIGPLYSSNLRTVALIVGSGVILWRASRHQLSGGAAVVALCALNLLVSNNTDWSRIAMFLPVGALVFRRDDHQVLWSLAVAVYGAFIWADLTGVIAVADDSTPSGLHGLAWVLIVNLPLLVMVAAGVTGQEIVAPYFDDAHDTNEVQPLSEVTSPA